VVYPFLFKSLPFNVYATVGSLEPTLTASPSFIGLWSLALDLGFDCYWVSRGFRCVSPLSWIFSSYFVTQFIDEKTLKKKSGKNRILPYSGANGLICSWSPALFYSARQSVGRMRISLSVAITITISIVLTSKSSKALYNTEKNKNTTELFWYVDKKEKPLLLMTIGTEEEGGYPVWAESVVSLSVENLQELSWCISYK